MSSSAAQLPSHCGGTCRHCGAVIGWRTLQTLQPKRGLHRPAGGRRRRRRRGCPDASHAVIAVSASSVRRADIRPTGRADVRCPGVRCPRPLQPRCPHRAGSRTSVRRDTPRLAHRVRRAAAVGERPGRRCPNRAWRGRDGRRLAVGGWHEARRQTWAPGRPREPVQRQVPVGWLGSTGWSRCVLGRLPA
jgi:hypothetical protein